MNRPFVTKMAILVGAVLTAFALTIYSPTPQGLIPFGVGQAEVRAAPGTPAGKAKSNYDLVALKLFNNTLVKVRDNYVDSTRKDARAMLLAALDSVQRNIAEVLVDAHEDRGEVVVTVNDKTQSFNIADVDSEWKLASRLKEVFRFINANMNAGSDAARIEYAAVNGMLQTLDPHSMLLDPESAREMDIQTSGKFGGIGILIGMRKDKKTDQNVLTVLSLLGGETPATRAGIKPGDQILKIGDEPTLYLTLEEAKMRLRGDPQTKIWVTISRGGEAPRPVELTRDTIRVPSIKSRLLAGGIGYMRMDQFSAEVASEMRRAMDELKKQGARAWVLDLRRNPGGLLDQAIRVADLFIDSGTLVTTVGYAGKQRKEERAQAQGTDHLPLAVLVDGNSASASEIVAGAVKNLDRGVIIGQQTFGKGSVQSLFEYDDGSKLKLTIAQYLTPNDVSIQSVGITPDIELDRVFVPEKLDSYKDMLRLLKPLHPWREQDLSAHLTSTNVKQGEKPLDAIRYIEPEVAKKPAAADDDDDDAEADDDDDEDTSDGFVEDFYIKFARELLVTTPGGTRSDLLRESKAYVTRRKSEEEAHIAQALSRLGVDWTVGPHAVGAPRLTARIETSKPENKVQAGEEIALIGEVTNSGSAPAYQVHGRARNDDWSFEGAEMVFGRVDPGQTKKFTLHLKVPQDAQTRIDDLTWEFTEAYGARVEAPATDIAVLGQARPQFAYTYQLVDEGGNGDGLLQLGESLRLHVAVKNVGKGEARNTAAALRNASGNGVVVGKSRYDLKTMAVGETKTLDFTFDVKKDFTDKEVALELSVDDLEMREGVNEKLKFTVQAPGAGPLAQKSLVKVARKDLEVRAGASDDSPIVGTAKRGAVLQATGKMGTWVRVEAEAGRPGFVAAAGVTPASGAATAEAFVPVWQVTPPTIALNVGSHETSSDKYTLTGTIADDNHLEDVYILVSNRDQKIDSRKVFYQSNRGSKNGDKLDFSTSIPLWKGNNLITVVARESNEVRAVQNVFILKEDAGVRTSAAEPRKDAAGH